MKTYGIPYMGSKDKIADSLLNAMPSGKRFVDLFGGGFAMSECALRSGKYEYVLYNDYNPLIVNLVMDAIKGKYNFKNFTPNWVSRADFERERESNGYVKYIWSFGNNGKAYLYGNDLEEWKHKAYDYVVFGKKDAELLKEFPDLPKYVTSKNIHERRLQFQRCVKNHDAIRNKQEIQSLERLECLQRLSNLCKTDENHRRIASLERIQSLQQLEALQRLEALSISYEDYSYQEGDVVYCDIPYEGTAEYSGGFDHQKFYNWVDAQPYPIYISSYRLENTKWKLVWAKCKVPLLNQQTKTRKYAVECLYRSK